MKNKAFLFPGQGVQSIGMGKDFYDHYTSAREIFQLGDELLGCSLSKIIFEGPSERLNETRNSQTGIYLTSIAIFQVLQEQFFDLKPSVCAGLSLGEYTAFTASKRIPFETCLPLIQFRGNVMNEACEETSGTMAAVFSLSAKEIEQMVLELNMPEDLWAANFNCPGQTVISGTQKGVSLGMQEAKRRGAKRVVPLKVHGAFHSGLMRCAEEKLRKKIQETTIQKSSIQIVMNVPGGYVIDVEKMYEYLITQVTSPVRWEQGIEAMMPHVDCFIEIGCGRPILAGMNKQIGVIAPTVTINKVADLDKLAKVMK